MLQGFATNTAGNAQIRVFDLKPDRDTAWQGNPGEPPRRWQDGDPIPCPVLMDYHTGAECCTRNPERYRPEAMSVEDHAAMVRRHHDVARVAKPDAPVAELAPIDHVASHVDHSDETAAGAVDAILHGDMEQT